MKERLKQLRNSLNLNQSEFAVHIGVSRSAISRLESGDINFTEQMILSICREFNVNRAWLVEGIGDMFADKTSLNDLAADFSLSDADKSFILEFCNLTKDKRAIVLEFLRGSNLQ